MLYDDDGPDWPFWKAVIGWPRRSRRLIEVNQTHLAAALFGALVAGLIMEACRYDAVEQAKARAIEACTKSIVNDVRPDNICKEILFRPKSHLTARFR